MFRRIWIVLIILLATAIVACEPSASKNPANPPATAWPEPSVRALRIEATSPVKLLEDAGILAGFTESTGIEVAVSYYGDVELMNKVKAYTASMPTGVDLMWLGSSVYAPGSLLQEKTSIMRTYVVMGINPDTAQALGWTLGEPVVIEQVIEAVESGALQLASPSASQDDAGANFLFAVIQAFNGQPYTTMEDLQREELRQQVKALFEAVAGSANNSATLRDRFIEDQKSARAFNGFILPEFEAIRVNLALEAGNLPTMQIVYIEDAIGVQEYPLAWIKGISEEKQVQFDQLVSYLRSEVVQQQIQSEGYFRTGTIGMVIDNPDTMLFRSEWGVITDRNFLPAPLPKDPVIQAALAMYQTFFKPPSETVWCLDYSGSMDGSGEKQRNAAMEIILDQNIAAENLLQAGPSDVVTAFLFSETVLAKYGASGGNPGQLLELYRWLVAQDVVSNTNMYGCVLEGLQLFKQEGHSGTLQSVILLTDGVHNTGASFGDVERYYRENGFSLPIQSIMLGEADPSQLWPLASLSNGLVCDGRGGQEALVQCFKDLRGSG